MLFLTCSLCPGDESLANVADVEHGWSLDIVPFFLGERIQTVNGEHKRKEHLSI